MSIITINEKIEHLEVLLSCSREGLLGSGIEETIKKDTKVLEWAVKELKRHNIAYFNG